MAYTKPGVYSRYIPTPGTVILGAGARIPAIIGVAPTYYTVVDEQVVRGSYPYGTQTDALDNTATYFVRIGDVAGVADYTEGTDYQLVGGVIEWLSGGDSPTAGDTYFVTYRYAKPASGYAAQLFSNMNDVTNEYGAPIYGNTLSLGIKIAFENGAPFVIGVQVTSDIDAGYTAAIDKLRYTVSEALPTAPVALSTSSTVQVYLYNHAKTMSSTTFRGERIGLIGMAVGSTIANIRAKATAFDSERLVLPYDEPTRDVQNSDGTYTERTLDSTYLACAVAGMMSKFDVQEPLTRKVVIGFKALTRQLLETEKDQMAGDGVLLFESKAGVITVRHQVTTNNNTPEEAEISVMQIRDYVIKNVRNSLDDVYIGGAITSRTRADVVTSVDAVLSKISEEGAIVAWGDITASQNATDPRQIDIGFSIKPAYPLNIIMITFTINPNL